MDLLTGQVFVQRAELSFGLPAVQRDLLEAVVQDSDRLVIPSHPHIASQVFGGNRIERTRHFNVSIAAHASPFLLIDRKQRRWQRSQRRAFYSVPPEYLGRDV